MSFPWLAACDVGEHQFRVDLRGEKNHQIPHIYVFGFLCRFSCLYSIEKRGLVQTACL